MPSLRLVYRRFPLLRDLFVIKTYLRDATYYLSAMEKRDREHRKVSIADFRRQLLTAPRYQSPLKLNNYELQVFSQNGEDGIISEIFRRIGTESKTFIEIGVGNGTQNNTVSLLFQGWRGAWVEGDQASVDAIGKNLKDLIYDQRLTVVQSLITAENVGSTISAVPFADQLDLLSIDIDRNTYWIWKALPHLKPRVIVMEYNGYLPPSVDWKVPYEPKRMWNGTTYYGASLKAFELLGREFGYSLVGCDLNGVNAFFVRNDLCGDKFEDPFTSEHHFEPLRIFLVHDSGLIPCFDDVPTT